MATFQYKAATAGGELVEGVLSGSSREQIIQRLQALGQVPIRVDETRAAPRRLRLRLRRRRISREQIADITTELATLLRAGLPLERALGILASLAPEPAVGDLLQDVRQRVKDGSTLADALEAQDGAFGPLYVSLVRAGESGGALELVLGRISDHLSRARELRGNLTSALIYPAILVVVAIVSVLILLGYVVPQFTVMFEGFGQVLPLPTRITIAAGEAIQAWGWLLVLGAAGALWFMRRQLAERASAYRWHAALLRVPLIGEIVVKMEVARFAHTLSTLLQNGIPLVKALVIVRDTMSNLVLARGLERVTGSLKEGQSLAAPLAEMPHFPEFAMHMIRVGEESGELEAILEEVATTYDRETQVTVKRALTLLEPMLILVLGVVIAAVILSILVAILSVNELVI